MKHLIFIVSLILSFLVCSAQEYRQITVYPKRTEETGSDKGIERAPIFINLQIIFNSNDDILEIHEASGIEGEVFMYDNNWDLQDYSSELNAIMRIRTRGTHYLRVEGRGWWVLEILEL